MNPVESSHAHAADVSPNNRSSHRAPIVWKTTANKVPLEPDVAHFAASSESAKKKRFIELPDAAGDQQRRVRHQQTKQRDTAPDKFAKDTLPTELSRIQAQLAQKMNDVGQRNITIFRLETERSASQSTIKKLECQLQDALQKLETERSASQGTIAKLERQFQDALQKQQDTFQKPYDPRYTSKEYEAKLEKYRKYMHTLKISYAKLSEELNQQKGACHELHRKLLKKNNHLEIAELKLQKSLDEAKKLKNDLFYEKKLSESAESELKESLKALSELESQSQQLKAEKKQLESDLSAYKNKYQKDIAASETLQHSINKTLKIRGDQLDALKSAFQQAQKTNEELQQKLSSQGSSQGPATSECNVTGPYEAAPQSPYVTAETAENMTTKSGADAINDLRGQATPVNKAMPEPNTRHADINSVGTHILATAQNTNSVPHVWPSANTPGNVRRPVNSLGNVWPPVQIFGNVQPPLTVRQRYGKAHANDAAKQVSVVQPPSKNQPPTEKQAVLLTEMSQDTHPAQIEPMPDQPDSLDDDSFNVLLREFLSDMDAHGFPE